MTCQRMWVLAIVLAMGALAPVRAVQAAQAEAAEAIDYPLAEYTAQVGVDAWRFSDGEPQPLLMMSTNTQWHYRTVSPWMTFDGRLQFAPQVTVTLKARSNQEMGSHLDELSADWSISPYLGLRAGVVDYKTSWCRTYDIDSPWVRENDPFCTVVTTSGPSGGAPGAQAYVNLLKGVYRVQGVAGIYSPLLMDYNTREFSNISYPLYHVDKNDKQGLSINVLNLETATEFRLGLLGAQQSAQVYRAWNTSPFYVEQTYRLLFAGVSLYLTPKINMRIQTLHHVMENKNLSYPGATLPHYQSGVSIKRASNVLELTYQVDSQDMLAFAINSYDYDYALTLSKYPFPGYTYDPNYYQYQQRAMSVAWRRDWARGVFTVLQATRGRLALEGTSVGREQLSAANGFGFRLGYRF